MDGILNINKATGMTSHDVVAKIRKILQQKRVGHAGTLDPAASGVLPICLGQGTRVAEYLSESGKAYQAEIIFGVVTDTYDREGTIIQTASVADLTLPRIEAALVSLSRPTDAVAAALLRHQDTRATSLQTRPRRGRDHPGTAPS